ncbi:hypothetical protein VB712_19055 [Spirulina sp. CCNP1310]|nr:hypothetical protein [Spirulina sp. CCNP1310]MEA5421328.1 hypothetical protein [Spirulina sp. CCNP1310]
MFSFFTPATANLSRYAPETVTIAPIPITPLDKVKASETQPVSL